MGATLSFSLNLSKIDKSKVVQGKKGTYYPITVFVNDDVDQFGNNVAVATTISKEEKEAGAKTVYLGNGRVLSTNGSIVAAPLQGQTASQPAAKAVEDDFPF